MDFRLTDDQLALQGALRAFCDDHYALEQLHEMAGRPLRGAWSRLAALDVFRVGAPAERAGLGLGLVDAAVVFEVLGEYLVPGPLVWSALAARFVPELAGGEAIAGGLDSDATPALVEHAADLDALLVVRGDRIELLEPTELEAEPAEPTDPLTPVAYVRDLPAGQAVRADLGEVRLAGTILSAALLTGIAQRAVDAAVGYAKERHQFGRAIGSFQAIKHLLADAFVRVALARSATYAAAAVFDDRDSGDVSRAAAAAKLLAADAAIRNARSCIQAHGGMGFTWEMVPHYLLKRAWVLENGFGTRAAHSANMASTLERELAR